MTRDVILKGIGLAAVGLVLAVPTQSFAGDIHATFQGSGDPTQSGWTLDGTAGTAVPDDMGVAAININTTSGVSYYEQEVPKGAGAVADNSGETGWALRAMVRVLDSDDNGFDQGVIVEYYDRTNETFFPNIEDSMDHFYQMQFGSDENGNILIGLNGAPVPQHHVADSGWHLYELIFRENPLISDNEGSGGASLYIDGEFIDFGVNYQPDRYVANHPSAIAGRDAPDTDIVGFGAPNGGSDPGNANFAFVQFETGSGLEPLGEIPEPSSLSLLALGGGLALMRRRRAAQQVKS